MDHRSSPPTSPPIPSDTHELPRGGNTAEKCTRAARIFLLKETPSIPQHPVPKGKSGGTKGGRVLCYHTLALFCGIITTNPTHQGSGLG